MNRKHHSKKNALEKCIICFSWSFITERGNSAHILSTSMNKCVKLEKLQSIIWFHSEIEQVPIAYAAMRCVIMQWKCSRNAMSPLRSSANPAWKLDFNLFLTLLLLFISSVLKRREEESQKQGVIESSLFQTWIEPWHPAETAEFGLQLECRKNPQNWAVGWTEGRADWEAR